MTAPQPRTPIRVVDLTPEHEPLYFVCLEDWPGSDVADAGDWKARWTEWAKPRGLRVKLALTADGTVGGMIQVLPIEHAPAVGRDLDFILCTWVHGHPQGRGDLRGRGLGSALLAAAEADSRERGRKGIAAWGLAVPVWMRASWYRRHGFVRADRSGLQSLVWKPFAPDAVAPRWLHAPGKRPEAADGRVVVAGCMNGWCPAQNLAWERACRAAKRFGDKVELRRIDTRERAAFEEWGQSDALWVDGRQVRTGPPPSEAKLAKLIRRRVERL
jgi:GNAT superfamily N-acetyltransferase